MFPFVEQFKAILIPLWCYCYWILVVDGQLLPHLDTLGGQDGDHPTKPWMVHPPPPGVWSEGMVSLMSQGGTVLVKPEEKEGYVRLYCPSHH